MNQHLFLKVFCFFVVVGLPLLAQNPRLVADLTVEWRNNPTSSYPGQLTYFNGKIYLAATHRDLGRKVFVYENGEVSLLEEAPGPELLGLRNLIATTSQLFFYCDNDNVQSLWVMGDVAPEPIFSFKSNPYLSQFQAVGDQLVFVENWRRLWVSDGTAEGTHELVSHPSGHPYPINGQVYNGLFYYSVENGLHGRELWRSDLTQAGTFMVAEITPGPVASDFYGPFVLGDKLVFLVENENAFDLWAISGPLDDPQLVVPGFVRSLEHVALMNGVLYINGSSSTVENGLFRTDGTVQGSFVIEEFEGGLSNRIQYLFQGDGDWLYFDLVTPEYGREVMRTDGSIGGLQLFHDINPGPADFIPRELLGYGGKIFIQDSGGILWAADDEGFSLVNQANPSGAGLIISQDLLFYYRDSYETGKEYWVFDGTEHRLLADFNGGPSSNPVKLVHDGGLLYFGMEKHEEPDVPNDPYHRWGLAQSNGNALGTRQIESFGSPWMTVRGNDLYYILDKPGPVDELMIRRNGGPPVTLTDTPDSLMAYIPAVVHGNQLVLNTNYGVLATDGSPEGTYYLSDMSYLDGGVSFDDYYYFIDPQKSLLRSDGTEGNATLVARNIKYLGTVVNNRLLVSEDSRLSIVASDGLTPIANIPGPYSFINIGGLAYFQFINFPWVTDGTAEGTRALDGIDSPIRIRDWVSLGDRVCMLTNSGLFIIDNFEAAPLANFLPGSRVEAFSLSDSLIVFRVDNQLWRSAGTPESTYKIMDLTDPDHFIVFNENLIFVDRDPDYGVEPWVSDGTIPGTHILADIQPGAASSYPEEFKAAGAELYFSAFNQATGRELWAYCRTPDAKIQTLYPRACVSGMSNEAWVPDAGPGANYNWTLEGASLLSNNGSSIVFTPLGLGPVTLSVTVSTSGPCSASDALQLGVVEAEPGQPEPIMGSTSLCSGAKGEIYSVVESDEVDEYQWLVPPGARIISGQGTSTIEVDFGLDGGSISVTPVNACGAGAPRVLDVLLVATQQALAGPYRELCGLSHVLEANTPGDGKAGFWTILSGIGGQFSDPTDPQAELTGLRNEIYHLRWTITSPLCEDSWDDTYIQFRGQPQAVVGPDQELCDNKTILTAQFPSYGIGSWEVVYAEGSYTSFNQYASQIQFQCHLSAGEVKTFVLRWTVVTPFCGEASDEVTLVFSALAPVTTGSNRVLSINDTPQLQASQGPNLEGTWEVVSGPSLDPLQFEDPADPLTTFTPSGGVGIYELKRAFTIGSCSSTPQNVKLSFDLESRTPRPILDGNGEQIRSGAYQPFSGAWIIGASDGLILTDFTPEGTQKITDRTSEAPEMITLGDKVLFSQGSGNSIWVSDGTDQGTMILEENLAGAAYLTEHQGYVYFRAFTSEAGSELWRSDGTPEGTQMVADLHPGPTGSFPKDLTSTPFGLFFRASGEKVGVELWLTAGLEEGTSLVKDIYPGTSSSYPGRLTFFSGKLYFTANSPLFGFELWETNGTEEGTTITADLTPGSSSTSFDKICVFNNHLLFTRGVNEQYEWWEIAGVGSQPQSLGASIPAVLHSEVLIGSEGVFFLGYDLENNRVLCITDGTAAGTRFIGAPFSWLTTDFVELNGVIYFPGVNGLWRTDGTTEGTYLLRDLTLSGTSDLFRFSSHDDSVIFVANGDEGNGFYRLVPEGGGTIIAPSMLCAGQGGVEAEISLDVDHALVHWSIVNGTITGGQGSTRVRFSTGGDGEVLLTAEVQLSEGDIRVLETRIPVTAMVYDQWNKPAESRHDLFLNGRVDIADFLLIMENCGGY